MKGLLGKSNGKNPLPITSRDPQLTNEFSEYFLLKVKRISDMFENIPPSKSQFIPDFPILSSTIFAEINKEEILCIVRAANETICANDRFHIRKMTSEIISYPIKTVFTDMVNSSFSTGVFPDFKKFAVVKPLLKACIGKDNLSSYRPLYNISFLSKVLETACLKQLNEHLSKIPALQKL